MFSPYNRIDLRADPLWLELQVNRDFHQYLHDFSAPRLADPRLTPEARKFLTDVRDLYDLPFVVNTRRGSALIVGAGTGNDVQAALRHGYATVTSVDIDARIIALGRERHPEKPYAHPGVRTVVDDARSFFGKARGTTFDVVCFGLLDSHAMSSAMSTLRLDNYVYTEEGIRSAWALVGPGGHLSLAISCAPGWWFFERLYWTITRATGREPLAFSSPLHASTVTFVVARPGAALDAAALAKRYAIRPIAAQEQVLTPSDDWPFLYVRPGVFPWGYVAVLGFVLALALVTVPRAFAMGAGQGGFDLPLFLMGAAFLLIETRGVTSMSLLFGSTWVVNAAIFGGIVGMVLLANLAVQRWEWREPLPWFAGLFGAVALLYVLPVDWLQSLPLAARGILAGVITGLPVGVAGLIVPMLLRRAAQPAAALGSNLLGAVLGGCLEYYSMLGGLRSTALMALVLYLAAFALLLRSRHRPDRAAS
jgi:SAM-dependent methyltransferase